MAAANPPYTSAHEAGLQATDDNALAGFDAIGDLAGFPVGIVIADAFHAPTGAAMDVADVAGASPTLVEYAEVGADTDRSLGETGSGLRKSAVSEASQRDSHSDCKERRDGDAPWLVGNGGHGGQAICESGHDPSPSVPIDSTQSWIAPIMFAQPRAVNCAGVLVHWNDGKDGQRVKRVLDQRLGDDNEPLTSGFKKQTEVCRPG